MFYKNVFAITALVLICIMYIVQCTEKLLGVILPAVPISILSLIKFNAHSKF